MGQTRDVATATKAMEEKLYSAADTHVHIHMCTHVLYQYLHALTYMYVHTHAQTYIQNGTHGLTHTHRVPME